MKPEGQGDCMLRGKSTIPTPISPLDQDNDPQECYENSSSSAGDDVF